jgi:hypothetical protein
MPWPNSRHYPDTFQEKLKKIYKKICQNSQYLNQGLLNAKQECKSLGSEIQSKNLILKLQNFQQHRSNTKNGRMSRLMMMNCKQFGSGHGPFYGTILASLHRDLRKPYKVVN